MAIGEKHGGFIVVIEDSDLLRNSLERTLRGEGYHVVGCQDADSGFDVVRQERPDLVLTDIGLGVTSGLDLITRIRSDLPAPQPVIIACSGFGGFKQEALARGADSFLPKPFDISTLVDAVAEALAGRPPSAPLLARASQRARALRRDAIVAAKAAQTRMKSLYPDYEQRGAWTTGWLPRYLGFGGALAAVIQDEHLSVFASSDPRFAKGDRLDESCRFCRDVVETAANLVIPDATLWSQTGLESGRFFAGVPLTDGEVAIGALALVDDEPHHFEGEDLALLEALGRFSSAALGALGTHTSAFWTRSGLIGRSGLRTLLTLEIKRSERTMSSLFLLTFETTDMSWRRDVEARLDVPRTAIAELGEDRFAVSLVREATDGAVRELGEMIQAVRQLGELRCGGLVSLTGGNVAMRSGDELIWLAEELCGRALRLGGDRIETVLMRHEPWPTALSPAQ